MGKSQSKVDDKFQNYEALMESYTFLSKMQHSMIGDASVLKDINSGKLILLKEIMIFSAEEFEIKINQFNEKTKLFNKNVIQLYGFASQVQSQLCGTYYKLFLCYEYAQENLYNLLDIRKQQQQYFPMKQIRQIFKGTIEGLAFLQSQNQTCQDLRNDTIFLGQDNEFKVLELDRNESMYLQALAGVNSGQGIKKRVYFCPNLINGLREKCLSPEVNNQKSNVYTLGMSILAACTLKDSEDLYDFDNFKVRQEQIQHRLQVVNVKYGPNVCRLLSSMLRLDERQRPDFLQLKNFLDLPGVQDSVFQLQEVSMQLEFDSKQNNEDDEIFSFKNGLNADSQNEQVNQSEQDLIELTLYQKNNDINEENNNQNTEQIDEISNQFKENEINKLKQQYDVEKSQKQYIKQEQFQKKLLSNDYEQMYIDVQHKIREEIIREQNQKKNVSLATPKNDKQKIEENISNDLFSDQHLSYRQTSVKKQAIESIEIQQNTLSATKKGELESHHYGKKQLLVLKNEPQLFEPQTEKKQSPEKVNQNIQEKKQEIDQFKTNESKEYKRNPHYDYTPSTVIIKPEFSPFQPKKYQESDEVKRLLDKYSKPEKAQSQIQIDEESILPIEQENSPQRDNSILQEYNSFIKKEETEVKPPQYQTIPLKQSDFMEEWKQKNPDVQQHKFFNISEYLQNKSSQNYDYNLEQFEQRVNLSPESTKRKENFKKETSAKRQMFDMNDYLKSRGYDFDAPKVKDIYSGKLNEQNNNLVQKSRQIDESIQNFQRPKDLVYENHDNGSKYEGYKQNGKRHGKGKFTFEDGSIYDGMWKENKMCGHGVLFYQNKKPAYDGEWEDDKFQGSGILYNEEPCRLNDQFDYKNFNKLDSYWIRYEGQFIDDSKHGKGTLYLTNGEKFIGSFKNDLLNGNGAFYTILGEIINGSWIDNQFLQ